MFHLYYRCALIALLVGLASPPVLASPLRETPIVKAVRQAAPSVVNIRGRKSVSNASARIGNESRSKEVDGMGTGIIIDPRGYILTNYHVVAGVARINVTLRNKATHVGTLVTFDRPTDLALVKIDASTPLPVIRFGTSADLMPGETVIALGNAYGYEHSVTRGIISALHRNVRVSDTQSYEDLIQTDASINPGNSGGPLLNIDGELIGINVAVRMGAQGIGFAMPINKAVDITSNMLQSLHRHLAPVGINAERVRTGTDHQALQVTHVDPRGLGHSAGLRPLDQITSVNGRPAQTKLDVHFSMLQASDGDIIIVDYRRQGKVESISLPMQSSLKTPGGISTFAWTSLGLKVKPAVSEIVQKRNADYQGGLTILSVRDDSPAQKQGIRRGDVLLGLHKWETVSLNNLAYIFGNEEFHRSQPVKFYILRDRETLFGTISINGQPAN
jgi:serine protease Do